MRSGEKALVSAHNQSGADRRKRPCHRGGAREHFLRDGFAGASMDTIAKSAGVSVKTIYSHFSNKNELFNKAMVGASTDHHFAREIPSEDALAQRFTSFSKATQQELFQAEKEYRGHLLSEQRLALYRVVRCDAERFPELGRQYSQTIARARTGILIACLRIALRKRHWSGRDAEQDAASYEGLLVASLDSAQAQSPCRIRLPAIEKR